MYLYYNKNGELLTIIPHGEIPRQNNYLNLYICLDYDYFEQDLYKNIDLGESNTNFRMLLDITKPNKITCVDNIPNNYSYKQFKKTNDSEVTFALVNGRSYWIYEFNIAPEFATNMSGEIQIAIKTFVVNNSNQMIDSTRQNFTAAKIYVEKTFTNPKNVNDTTYFQLERQINLINANLTLLSNRMDRLVEVGIEISLEDIGYTEPDGTFVPEDFESYCTSFGQGKILIYTFTNEDMETYPKLWNFIKSCSTNAADGLNSITIMNIYEMMYSVKLLNSAGKMISYEYFNNKWNNSNASAMITTTVEEPLAPEENDIWYQIIENIQPYSFSVTLGNNVTAFEYSNDNQNWTTVYASTTFNNVEANIVYYVRPKTFGVNDAHYTYIWTNGANITTTVNNNSHPNIIYSQQQNINQYSVNISKGNNLANVFTSTNPNATSGNISGTKYNYDTTVYAFAVLKTDTAQFDYLPPLQSDWVLIEGNVYQVGSVTVDGNEDFGTFDGRVETKKYQVTFTAGENVQNAFTSLNQNGTDPHSSGYEYEYGQEVYYFVTKKADEAVYEYICSSGTQVSGNVYRLGSIQRVTENTNLGTLSSVTKQVKTITYTITMALIDSGFFTEGDPYYLNSDYEDYQYMLSPAGLESGFKREIELTFEKLATVESLTITYSNISSSIEATLGNWSYRGNSDINILLDPTVTNYYLGIGVVQNE